MSLAPFTRVDRDALGQIVRVEPTAPVQVVGLHTWNLLLYRAGHAAADRRCA